MTRRPRTRTSRTAPFDFEALVGRVIAGVVELRGANRPVRSRVEQDDVARRDRPRSHLCSRDRTAAPASSRGGRPSARVVIRPFCDAFGVEDRQERLDPGRAVADHVERDAAGRVALLDRDAVGDVVRGDEIERAVREPFPEGVAICCGPERWRDHVLAQRDGIGLVVLGLGQDEVVRDTSPRSLGRPPPWLGEPRRGPPRDERWTTCIGAPAARANASARAGRDRLDIRWSRSSVVAW